MNRLRSLVLLILLFTQAVVAEQNVLPEAMYYANQPIKPHCFDDLGLSAANNYLNPVNLKTCSKRKILDISAEGISDAGFIRYKYIGPRFTITVEYKYLGNLDDNMLLWLKYTGGSTGSFSKIIYLKRAKDQLTKTEGPVGNRCNGEITEAKIENNHLVYEQYITPFDILNIAQDNPKSIKPYDDLAACALCCIGTAKYRDNQFEAVNFYLGQGGDYNSQGKYQACFNQIYQEYIKQGKNRINISELKAFTKEFNAQCLKQLH